MKSSAPLLSRGKCCWRASLCGWLASRAGFVFSRGGAEHSSPGLLEEGPWGSCCTWRWELAEAQGGVSAGGLTAQLSAEDWQLGDWTGFQFFGAELDVFSDGLLCVPRKVGA